MIYKDYTTKIMILILLYFCKQTRTLLDLKKLIYVKLKSMIQNRDLNNMIYTYFLFDKNEFKIVSILICTK